jgi:hypothetical protein
MGVIKCEMKKPADLDKNVPEIEAEGDDLKNGKDDDRNIELYFKMPIEVAQAIKTTVKPQEAPGINVVPTEDPGNSDSESSSGMCFMTSALI